MRKKLLEECYDRLINVGFCLAPYQDLSDMVDPDVMIFGTTKDEKIFSLEELKEFFKSQYRQMENIEPSLERKRLYTQISEDQSSALIAEDVTLNLVSEDIINSLYLRTSCVMQYSADRWRLTHWHASTPVETENDHWHMEEWKREKEKLQNLVDKQTADLHVKNRQLEIEAAIERVRAVAMGMTQPDDMLDVCRVISDQLEQFGVEGIRNVQTVIIDEANRTYKNYQYFTPYDKKAIEITNCDENPVVHEMTERMLESPDAFFTGTLGGEEFTTFRAYRKQVNQFTDPLLDDINAINYHFFSIGPGGLGITLYRPLNEEGLEIFKRFHNVFSLTYRRFRDIEKAEAQAREAQIELSLERIRAQATAMKESSDLLDIVVTMRTEFVNLGHEAHYFWHMRWLPDHYQKAMTSGDGTKIGMVMTLPRHIHGDIQPVADWEKSDKATYVLAMDVDAAVGYVDKMITLGDFEQVDPQAPTLDDVRHIGGLTFIMARTTHGEIGYSLPGVVPDPSKDAIDTLVRFAGVFDLAYKRFEDLKAAERQNREAQIELALERVRARTMAMQHSDELIKTSELMFEQIKNLDIELWSCGFSLWYDDDSYFLGYNPGPDGKMGEPLKIPLTEDDFFKTIREAKRRGDEFLVFESEGKSLEDTYRYMDTLPVVGETMRGFVEAGYPLPTYQVTHCGFFSNGHLMFITQEQNPEAVEIFKRFTKIFNQTYTRFLDLQKAEEQARESEIELALERVRSRSMAMHKTDELQDVVRVVAEELKNTGVILDTGGAVICTYFQDSKDVIHWTATEDPAHPSVPYLLPYFEDELFDEAWASKNRGDDYFAKEFSYDVKNAFFNHAFEHSDYRQLPDEYKKIILESKSHGLAWAWSENSAIMIPSIQGDLPSEEEKKILIRFAKVFEQSFIRFLDLQKAEEQAREAKIETALEKVRSRSLAMHKSDELNEVVKVLFEKMTELEVPSTAVGIQTFTESSKDMQCFVCGDVGTGIVISQYLLPYFDHPILEDFHKARDKELELYVGTYSKKEKDSFYDVVLKLPELKDLPAEVNSMIRESEVYEITMVPAKKSVLAVNDFQGNRLSEGQVNILKRFAKVFDQAYTRFIDLQKAEAQAREAKIETALEKVRSRTMGMQSSDELPEVANLLFLEVQALGIPAWSCGYCILEEDRRSSTCIMSSEGTLQKPFLLPHHGEVSFEEWDDFVQGDQTFFTQELGGKAIESHYDFMKSLPQLTPIFREIVEAGLSLPTYQINHLCKFAQGFLLFITYEQVPDAHDLFKRFTKVFDQTYTRFLDLQKAEAQAREAKIEAALERVRARSMGMHKSDDLIDVVREIGNGIHELGIQLHYSQIYTDYTQDPKTGLNIWVDVEGRDYLEKFHLPYIDHSITLNYYNALNEGLDYFSDRYSKAEKDSYFKLLFKYSDLKRIPKKRKELILNASGWTRFTVILNEATLNFGRYTLDEFTDEEHEIFIRFAKVFGQAYTRFLDLQKAEAQAREAQVNLAVERVRAKALAMFKSEEILEVVYKLRNEIMGLNIPNVTAATIHLEEPDGKYRIWDLTSIDGDEKELEISLDIIYRMEDTHPDFFMREVWSRTEDYFVVIQSNDRAKHTVQWLQQNGYSEQAKGFEEFLESGQMERAYHPTVPLNNGRMGIDLLEPPVPEIESILKKMAGAFDLAYKRFEDLQKAEEQAREAEIQLALERVRARSMAMHKSEELLDVITVVSEQLQQLNFRFNHVSFANNEIDRDYKFWTSLKDMDPLRFNVPFADMPVFTSLKAAQQNHVNFYTDIITREENREWHEHLLNHAGSKVFSEEINKYIIDRGMARSIAINPNIILILANYASVPYTEEENKIIARFGRVFEQTYTRFLDLQKAEAQAREAMIETALEKIRSRTMAMQKGEELQEVAVLLYKELISLGVTNFVTCGYVEINEEIGRQHTWVTSPGGDTMGLFHLPLTGDDTFDERYAAWKNQEAVFHQSVAGKVRSDHLEYAITTFNSKEAEEMVRSQFPDPTVFYCFNFPHGYLHTVGGSRLTQEEENLLARFTKVFAQTYTRFLDLQKAEAQAREAQIENALEKVRSRSLAMQSPDELVEVAQLLREEMGVLGVEELETSSIYIHDESRGLTQCWFTIKDAGDPGKSVTDQMTISLQDTWVGRQMDEFYRSDQDRTSILMKGDQRIEWIRYCEEKSDLFGTSEFYGETIPERTYHLYKFSNGFLGAASPGDISEESWDLMKRATGVFSFAYTRFTDLQKAEESARRARQQASLDRVRADISAMRTADDLNRVTPLIWSELTTLGIPFVRCGVFIMHEDDELVEVYLSKPDGTSLAVMHLPFDTNDLTVNAVKAWRNKDVYRQQWTKEEFQKWGHSMMESGQIENLESYQGDEDAPESLHLHFVPFNQGLLYVGSINPLNEEEINLSQSLAKAFSIAYARYEDFIKLEQAKQKIEEAFRELEAAKDQLVQQEKLASLGQLTAGIAHEIKNPLNFVNNFSDLSVELIQEAREEIESIGAIHELPLQDVRDILNDIEANLKTIHKHGTRADGIVKSMLQHSRGGSGKMEPADLNALIKEYANLAFHGMRAGKDPINVDIELDLDKDVGEVHLIAEDFSRVILNLCTNAFDAMREKAKVKGEMAGNSVEAIHELPLQNSNYHPKLTVRTHQTANTVIIGIEDNGPGIPEDMKDKILQPFFTTKKGTQGTGLGLSITNDIVKAHGGNLEVASQAGKRTTFTIGLPKRMKP